MKVSIVIPVYNVESYIEKCLVSAINQSYNKIEIILVDDCGDDNSMHVAKQVIQKYRCTKIFKIIKHQRNRGLSAARNTGIFNSTGDYIYFLDSDDHITKTCIEKLVYAAKIYDPDFLIADYKTVGASRLYPPLNLKEGIIDSNDIILKTYFSRDWYMMAVNKLIKTVFIIKNHLFFKEGIVHEDDLWSFMVACRANSLYVLKERTYIYVIRKGSITQNPTLHNLDSRSKIISGMVDFIKEHTELIGRKDVYNYVEELKSQYFFNILSENTSLKFKYQFYKRLRVSTYVKPTITFKEYNLTFAQFIRNLHYILPSAMGYSYYRFCLKLKNNLGI